MSGVCLTTSVIESHEHAKCELESNWTKTTQPVPKKNKNGNIFSNCVVSDESVHIMVAVCSLHNDFVVGTVSVFGQTRH